MTEIKIGGNVIGYWPKEKIEILLNEYENRPVLWDTKLKGYHSKRERDKAYNEIGRLIHEPRDSVARKLNNLRSQYAAEIKKIERSKLTDEVPYIPKWWLFKRFSFIKEYPLPENADEMQTAVSAVEEDYKIQMKEQETLNIPTSTYIIRLNNNNNSNDSEESQLQLEEICAEQYQPPVTEIQPFQFNKKRKTSADAAVQVSEAKNQNKVLSVVPDPPSNNDAFDSYAKYIAGEMRSIPDVEQTQLLKLKIQQLIYYAHKGWLQESEN